MYPNLHDRDLYYLLREREQDLKTQYLDHAITAALYMQMSNVDALGNLHLDSFDTLVQNLITGEFHHRDND